MKKYLLTAEVDIEQLINSYVGDDKTLKDNLPPIEELILFECGWLNASGLQVYKVEELLSSLPNGELTSNTTISIEWSIGDVNAVALEKFNKTLSNNDALVVLQFVKQQHDATIGISWMVIEEAIETLLERKEIK